MSLFVAISAGSVHPRERLPTCHSPRVTSAVAMNSSCPASTWLVSAIAGYGDQHKELTFFNVGANKGFAVASTLQLLAGPTSVTNALWHAELVRYLQAHGQSAGEACGACFACNESPPPVLPDASGRELHIHAFELLLGNVAWLRHAFEHFGVRASLTHGAAANESGVAQAPVESKIGQENVAALSSSSRASAKFHKRGHKAMSVPRVALDDYVSQQGLRHVHYVSIDTEGYDALVVEGLHRSLRAGLVDLLEFEVTLLEAWIIPDQPVG